MSPRDARGGTLVLGGGFAGSMVARGLGRRGATLVSAENSLLFTPLLPEAASGTLEMRHVTVPLRAMCPDAELVVGRAFSHDPHTRTVGVLHADGVEEIRYRRLVVAVGSVPRLAPVDGLETHAVGFRTVADALYLRNHVLGQLEQAEARPGEAEEQGHLGFVFVGAGYAGVEALGELHDLVRAALRYYPEVSGLRQRWCLVDLADRILPEVPGELGRYAAGELEARGVEIRTGTSVRTIDDRSVVLDDGTRIPTRTVVWTAGVAPNPVVADIGLPVDDAGRVQVGPTLAVRGLPHVWALGDCAAVPNAATPGRPDPPTAQHAMRQARCVVANLVAAAEGRPQGRYAYRSYGQVATLGRYRGIAALPRLRLSGFPGWFLTRTYHLFAMPSWTRKVRIVADWTLSLLFPRDTAVFTALRDAPVSLGAAAEAERAPGRSAD
jgi:NADH:ubiquinone reductase (H+-translocating)